MSSINNNVTIINIETEEKRDDLFRYILDKKRIHKEAHAREYPKRKLLRKKSITNVGAEEYIGEENEFRGRMDNTDISSTEVMTLFILLVRMLLFCLRRVR